jgi:hypothetical protein
VEDLGKSSNEQQKRATSGARVGGAEPPLQQLPELERQVELADPAARQDEEEWLGEVGMRSGDGGGCPSCRRSCKFSPKQKLASHQPPPNTNGMQGMYT